LHRLRDAQKKGAGLGGSKYDLIHKEQLKGQCILSSKRENWGNLAVALVQMSQRGEVSEPKSNSLNCQTKQPAISNMSHSK
jgi:hypothetical protein